MDMRSLRVSGALGAARRRRRRGGRGARRSARLGGLDAGLRRPPRDRRKIRYEASAAGQTPFIRPAQIDQRVRILRDERRARPRHRTDVASMSMSVELIFCTGPDESDSRVDEPLWRRAPVTSRCNEPKPVRQKRRLRSEGALGHASNTRSTPTTSKGAPDRHRSATQATDTATSTYRHTAIQQPQPRARARARHVRLPKIDVDAADLVRSR